MTVDEVVADVRAALGLADTDVLVNIIVIGEYVTLDQDAVSPERRRLAMHASDELEPWTSIGMLRFAQMREDNAVRDFLNDEDDDE